MHGTVPIFQLAYRQGGIATTQDFTVKYPVAFSKCVLSASVVQLYNGRDDKYTPRVKLYTTTELSGFWGSIWNSGGKSLWLVIGV